MSDEPRTIPAAVEKIALHQAKRHVFLCLGPKCCTLEEGQAAWQALKDELRAHGLSRGDNVCQRTKVDCLRICTGGPTMLVYPEGTWYCGMKAERMPRFVQEHLVNHQPVKEWIFAQHRLDEPNSPATESGR